MRKLLALGGLFVLVFLTGFWYVNSSGYLRKAVPEDFSLDVLRSHIRASISKNGAEDAYAFFKKEYTNEDPDTGHNAAHIFGETLYSVLGINGVGVCDGEFSYGCYHGLFIRAVSNEGLSVVQRLDVACGSSDQPSACRHGIGHGILAYLGNEHLSDALNACVDTYQPDPVAGCTSGVFMEYNIPLSTNDDGTFAQNTRTLENVDEPYHPCTEVAQRFQTSCYHELPQWWAQTYGQDFALLGSLCEGIEYREGRRSCFSALGSVVSSYAKYDGDMAESYCRQISSSFGINICLYEASVAIAVYGHDREGALRLCALVAEPLSADCPK